MRVFRATIILLLASTLSCVIVPLFGGSDLGYYYANWKFGSQREEQSLIIDTGSYKTMIDCDNCTDCGTHLHPHFNRAASTSLTTPNSISGFACTDCAFESIYYEGSAYYGEYVQDIVQIGDKDVYLTFGCISSETKLFVTQKADGISGIGPLKDDWFEQSPVTPDIALLKQNIISSDIVSLCLGSDGGSLAFGEQNNLLFVPEAQSLIVEAGHDRWDTQFDVFISSVNINGVDLNLEFKTFVDSGTTYTYLEDRIYNAIVEQITTHCAASQSNCGGSEKFSACFEKGWLSSEDEFMNSFPTIKIAFGTSGVFEWRPNAYLVPQNGGYCAGIDKGSTILGATFMKHNDFSFDKGNKKLTITRANCSETGSYKHRSYAPNIYNKHLQSIAAANIRHRWVPYSTYKEWRLYYGCMFVIVAAVALFWTKKAIKINTYRELSDNLEN